jgi:hypothetical protein
MKVCYPNAAEPAKSSNWHDKHQNMVEIAENFERGTGGDEEK